MGQINIGGANAAVQLQGYTDSSITSDQTFTFPDESGELLLASAANNIGTGGTAGQGQVVGYQTGTWDLEVTDQSGGVPTYEVQIADYSRIGSTVTIWGRVNALQQGTAAGGNAICVIGLPYAPTVATVNRCVGSCYASRIGTSLEQQVVITVLDAQNRLSFLGSSTVSTVDAVSARFNNLGAATGTRPLLVFQGTYQTTDTTWTPSAGAAVTGTAAFAEIQAARAAAYAASVAANPSIAEDEL